MPLDRIQAKKLVNAAASAYGRGVHSEFIGKIAEQLNESLAVIDAATMDATKAKNEVARIQREIEEEKTQYRLLREKYEILVAATTPAAAEPVKKTRKPRVGIAALENPL